ncbi:type II toxin-antitoxin system VapC family toxin [Thiothrix unzii]|jgi:predicted nucleic acid-binding protein|uniref:type II toxin-antitoxin system VapC family toxin n=1 Tax=Thiothrix unzii TaxID=111769 RepID=UPI002A3693CC|nr:type II toxin-antitoxin system VapC family toxin [Thiothrix unzii]MDX9987304.1 type II toxin-antitoxin system VapC family toxin [Thiothrix unzii]
MNVVDSCGWLEYFADGANADKFAAAIEDTQQLIVPVISIFEVFKRVLQQRGEDAALQAVAIMSQGQVIDLDMSLALMAAKLSAELKMPMADSIILTTARQYHAVVLTQDNDFEGVAGVEYFKKVT